MAVLRVHTVKTIGLDAHLAIQVLFIVAEFREKPLWCDGFLLFDGSHLWFQSLLWVEFEVGHGDNGAGAGGVDWEWRETKSDKGEKVPPPLPSFFFFFFFFSARGIWG